MSLRRHKYAGMQAKHNTHHTHSAGAAIALPYLAENSRRLLKFTGISGGAEKLFTQSHGERKQKTVNHVNAMLKRTKIKSRTK